MNAFFDKMSNSQKVMIALETETHLSWITEMLEGFEVLRTCQKATGDLER